MSVVLNSTTFNHLLPDGTVYRSVVYAGELLDRNTIGEYRRIDMNLSLPTSTADRDFYFVPGIWMNEGGYPTYGSKPTTGWKYSTFGAPITGVEYDMNLIVASGYTPPASKNIRCTITFVTATNYIIKLYHYLIWDEHSFLLPSYQDNHSKWLKSSRYDTSELPTLAYATSGYGAASDFIQTYHYVTENNVVLPSRPVIDILASRYLFIAGWYNKNPVNAAPYFENPEFILSRVSGTVTNLSASEDTKVTFRIGTTVNPPVNILLRLIRTDTIDNTIDFITNYEDSFADVLTVGGSSTIDNKFKAPSTAPALVTGKTQVDIYIDKTTLVFGQTYRLQAVCYYINGSFECNTFMSDPFTVDDLPRYTEGIEFEQKLMDVDNEYTGADLECVVEERMRSQVKMDVSGWAASILARLGLVTTNDIRRYLTEVTVDVYEETVSGPTTTKHVFSFPQAFKTSPTTYTVASGVTMDFSVADEVTFKYDFRNRYEAHLANLYTYVNGVLLTSPTSTMNWAARTINIKWGFKFLYDDYSTPFSDTLYLRQMIRPKGYESGTFKIEQDGGLAQGERDPDFFCTDDLCFEAQISNYVGYKLITTIEPDPGSILGIEEHEVWVPAILPQQTNTKILSQEENFGDTEANKANFCLNSANILVNLPYKISAIAKRSNTDEIQTEGGVDLLTEGGDIIITE